MLDFLDPLLHNILLHVFADLPVIAIYCFFRKGGRFTNMAHTYDTKHLYSCDFLPSVQRHCYLSRTY